jgi:alkylation response protein AidB-like acyl-CoA dehydrogenase
MDFSWSDDDKDLYNSIVSFCHSAIKDDIIEADREERFPRGIWDAFGDFGLMNMILPEKYSGLGLSPLSCARLLEGAGYGCKDNGIFLAIGAHIWAVEIPLLRFGNEDQKQKWLPLLGSGKMIGAHAITEPNNGSDVMNLHTTAEKYEDCYILNGRKTFITNAPVADLFLVFATINKKLGFTGTTGFLIEKDTPGMHIESKMSKMGLRTTHMSEIVFENCRIPKENILGKEKQGHKIFSTAMMWERTMILVPFLGAIQREIENSSRYAQSRRQFNKPIASFQEVRNKIVEMQFHLESARLLLYKAAWLLENGDASMASSLAKLAISEASVFTFQNALQIFGGYGYMTESEIERYLRDSIGAKLYSGTTEIQKEIIAHCLGL